MLAVIRYFGAKHLLARHYGPPRRNLVIEPFAGSAGYSSFWEPDKVLLVEKDPMLVKIWRWLISASHDDIMDLPAHATHADHLLDLPEEIQYWIRLWFNLGAAKPSKSFRPEIKNRRDAFWGENVRGRIAKCIHRNNHWEVMEGDYSDTPIVDAHYHIDPPYQFRGSGYRFNNAGIDYEALASWCLKLKCGDVCEAEGADWLPFEVLRDLNNQNGKTYKELVYRLDEVDESVYKDE